MTQQHNLAQMPTEELSEHDQQQTTGMVASATRATQEIQAALIIAKRFPRDVVGAIEKIKNACTREGLATRALYSYSRGGQEVTGPSIRLAEAVAQLWGNLHFDWQITDQGQGRDGVGWSEIHCFCWDWETNTRASRTFRVRHWRDTKRGGYELKDERDIYELAANQASRRLRACILGIIPTDVVEEAVTQCETTMAASADTSEEATKRLTDAFAQLGVDKSQIEARIQRKVASINPAQVIQLRKIYQSIRDGISTPEEWFEGKHAAAAHGGRPDKPLDPSEPLGDPEQKAGPETKPETKPELGEPESAAPDDKPKEYHEGKEILF